MYPKYVLMGVLLVFFCRLDAQKPDQQPFNYVKKWNTIEELETKGLYQSALAEVATVKNAAKKAGNSAQLLKSILHEIKYMQYLVEEPEVKKIAFLESEVKLVSFPVKPVIQSLLAEAYRDFYQNNRYRYGNRSETAGFKNDDILTWSFPQIVAKIIENYQASLAEAEKLKKTSIDIFPEVILPGNKAGKALRPTLYDFLAHRAIDYFMHNEPDLTLPAYSFTLNSADYFLPAHDFIKLEIHTRDTFSYKYYALNILQELIRSHLKDPVPDALIDTDLKRLDFVHNYSSIIGKEKVLFEVLQAMEKKYNAYKASAWISIRIAETWNQMAFQYRPHESDEHKWDRKKAYDICAAVIKRFPGTNEAARAHNLQQEIKTKEIESEVEKVNIPGKPFRALVSYRNFTNLYWRAVPVSYHELIAVKRKWENQPNINQEEKLVQFLLSKSQVKGGSVILPNDNDFNLHSAEIKIDALKTGPYCIIFSNNEKFVTSANVVSYAFTTISDLAYYHRNRESGSSDLYVVNRTSGKPVPGAGVQVFMNEYIESRRAYELSKGESYITDQGGYISIPYQYDMGNRHYGNLELSISIEGDTINTFNLNNSNWEGYGHFYQSRSERSGRTERTHFFLDRAIYRPGQTIYYKGLVVSSNHSSADIITKRKLTVTFFDVNRQVVATQDVTTNQYGSFSGSFTAPSSGLMGQMSLQASNGSRSSVYFSVEEYKRPKFEVKFEPVKGSYRLGETVTVQGKALAYSGADIDGAAVKYRVVRKAEFPFWWWSRHGYFPSSPEMEIVNGNDTTAADGKFTINFTAIPDENVSKHTSPTFRYEISADVTDINGETHSSSVTVGVGYKALLIGADMKDIDKNAPDSIQKLKIRTTNLSGEFEPASGTITIWKLHAPEKAYNARFWQRPDKFIYTKEEFHSFFPNDVFIDENNFMKWDKETLVLKTPFNTLNNREIDISEGKNWAPGKYMLQVESRDKYGEEVMEVAYFEVSDKSVPAIPVVFDLKPVKNFGEPGEYAVFQVNSSGKVKYLYELERDGQILEKHWFDSEGQQVHKIPIKEEYRGDVTLHAVAVINNRMYSKTENIRVPYTNKKLNIQFETFRDKLKPGEQEQWRIKITAANADKAMAEMVASLYDASLDVFRVNNWNAAFFNSFYSRLRWQSLNGFGSNRFREYDINWNNYRYKDVTWPVYPELNWFYPAIFMEEVVEHESPAFLMVEENASFDAPPPPPAYKEEGGRLKKARVGDVATMNDTAVTKPEDLDLREDATVIKEPEVQIRKNFNETAFFYPHLMTNAQGEIIINFTIPEALTRWKMLGFAHTTDLKSGFVKQELVTQKDLMVVPNPPRFFRENDRMIFQAKVNSLVDKVLDGQVRLEFFDALTMQPVDALLKNTSNTKDFTIKDRQSINLEWSIEIPEGIQAIAYRIVARAGEFSDGEEMVLPVVTNRTLVTETLPLPVRGKQTKEFRFEKLATNNSNTLKHHRYTLEFTSNPAWYAIQALPYLIEYPYECTEQTFSRFYANSIAAHIANSNPLIKRVFDTWATIQPDALLSNLEKNQELKTALLQETPWVLNAKSESQRKRNVALLFDLNRMGMEQERALKKVAEAQLSNGGFPWFPGLPDDMFITQYIVSSIGHLGVMGVNYNTADGKVTSMLNRAIGYMDNRMYERHMNLLDEAKKGNFKMEEYTLGYHEVQYLYARSYFINIPVKEEHKTAFEFWKRQGEKFWIKHNLYTQGMLALALKRFGNTKAPAEIVKSLKERALHSEELGMYWKTDRGYFWYQAPVETQALMIEVFDEVAGDTKAVEDLKVWLLKQKQTQDWETTKATAEACFALLRRGTDVLAGNKLVEITVGNEKIDPLKRSDTKVEAGTGYFKTAWTAPEIKPEMGTIKVKKTDEGVAWGAVYWQYFEQLDKITGAETPLKLSKKLFKQVNTDRGLVITPVTDSSMLHVGDIVQVRVELRADRTMEYIHLKDMRASAFEPVETLSGYKYQDGLWYYQSPGDMATNFFIGYLPKGTYVFEYSLRVSQAGDFSNGITTVQCMYAPEFSSHSEGIRVKVVK